MPLHDHSDEQLLRLYIGGEPRAFEALVSRYKAPLFNFILRSTRDTSRAEDVFQDVWVRVVNSAVEYRGEAKFSTWLYTIARNLCVDAARKAAHRKHASLDAQVSARDSSPGPTLLDRVADDGPTSDREAIAHEMRVKLAQAVDDLPDEQREVFVMREVAGRPFREIAEVLGIPENTVKSRMRYALLRLTEALSEYQTYIESLK